MRGLGWGQRFLGGGGASGVLVLVSSPLVFEGILGRMSYFDIILSAAFKGRYCS